MIRPSSSVDFLDRKAGRTPAASSTVDGATALVRTIPEITDGARRRDKKGMAAAAVAGS